MQDKPHKSNDGKMTCNITFQVYAGNNQLNDLKPLYDLYHTTSNDGMLPIILLHLAQNQTIYVSFH